MLGRHAPIKIRRELRPLNWLVNSQTTCGDWRFWVQERSNLEHQAGVGNEATIVSPLTIKLIKPLAWGKSIVKHRYLVGRNLSQASTKNQAVASIACSSGVFFFSLVR